MLVRSVGTNLWSMSRKRVVRVNTITREITELERFHFTYRIMAFKDSNTYQRGAHFIKHQPIVDIFVCFKWSLRKPWLLIQREIEDIRARARKVCYQLEPKTVFSWHRSAGNYFSFLREVTVRQMSKKGSRSLHYQKVSLWRCHQAPKPMHLETKEVSVTNWLVVIRTDGKRKH